MTVAASASAEKMHAALRERGLKLTPQRLAIIRALADDPSHPTAQELYARLRGDLPTMSFATVYNTLSALADAALCVPRALTSGSLRFDPNCAPHDHAVCDRCAKVLDVPRERSAPSAPTGFHVRVVERIYRGLCDACLAEARDRAAGAHAHAQQDQHHGD
jgi:Fur family peroxide stress response transcriptional regulator